MHFLFIFKRHEQNLALPPIEKAALECVKAGLETWEYKAKNALMYYPEGEYTKTIVNKSMQEWTEMCTGSKTGVSLRC